MTGDTAGLITTLCGNGMAMAIHSAAVCSNIVLEHWTDFNRDIIEEEYSAAWNGLFSARLQAGRVIQSLFGSRLMSELTVLMGTGVRPIAEYLMSKTHGKPF